METLKVDASETEIQKRIEQHDTALRLLPDGKVKQKLQADVERLRSILELKRLLA